MVNGRPKVYYGTIAAVAADNLGSLALAGFEESCTAYRMCRHCLATKESAKTQVCMCTYRGNYNFTYDIL